MASAADYIPEDALIILTIRRRGERARDYTKRLAEDIRELTLRGVLAMSPDAFYLSWEALIKRLEDFPVYMAEAFTVGRAPCRRGR